MTYQELRWAIEKILPAAMLDEDEDGQIIIYTDLMIDENFNSEVVPYTMDDEDGSER